MNIRQDMIRADRRLFYEQELLKIAPRLLSSLDRCPVSATGGSLDREYWAWATKDFSNADLQRGLYVLAYLYSTPFDGNYLHRQNALAQWIMRGIKYWIKQQDWLGGFEHLYVNENSWMAAGFTLSDILDTYSIMETFFDINDKRYFFVAIKKSGDFLCLYDELHGFISNHRAGAASALLNLQKLTGNEKYGKRALELIGTILENQSAEGWYKEYEGADPGYLTLDLHYQAKIYLAADDGLKKEVLESVSRSLEFISYFMHPDGSVGGEYGSRNCTQYFPSGFEFFANLLPIASAMAAVGVTALKEVNSSGLHDADIRNIVPMATSYLLAHKSTVNSDDKSYQTLPFEQVFDKYFLESGLSVFSDDYYYVIFGASKGGVIKIFNKKTRNLLFSSVGYSAKLQNGDEYSTLHWITSPRVKIHPSKEDKSFSKSFSIEVESEFFRFFSNRTMSTLKLILFRIFNLTAGRVRSINDFVRKNIIIKKYLVAKKGCSLRIVRKLIRTESGFILRDDIRNIENVRISNLLEHGFFSSVYMASARYFRRQDFVHEWSSPNLASKIKATGFLTRETKIK